MGGKKLTAKTIKRKGAPTHPNSRRAHQLTRVAHRETKLGKQKRVRKRVYEDKVERLLTIIGLLDPEVTHLEDLAAVHAFIKESVLPIAQERLAEEQAARRPGRPPSPDEVMLQDLVAREKEEYRTGMEIPDLTNEINVRLLRQWDGDKQGLALFRLVRISEAEPNECRLMQAGSHKELQLQANALAEAEAASKAAPPADELMHTG